MRALLAAALLLLASPEAARADTIWDRALAGAEASSYQLAMDRGDRYADRAQDLSYRQRKLLVEKAAQSYEEAIAARPDAAEPHYRLAELLRAEYLENHRFIPRGPDGEALLKFDPRVAARALRHYDAFERLAPLDPRATDMLLDRALIHTKMATEEHFEKALADYKSLLGRRDLGAIFPRTAALVLYNCAETLMMLGRLDEAIPMYQRSLAYENSIAYAFSLAVALDRDEQGARARELLAGYVRTENDLRPLIGPDSSIFFVPAGELFYYVALGFEVLGDHERARMYYERFVRSGAHPRFHPRANEHIKRLSRAP